MKENKSFIQALKVASQAANAKNSLPILDYFLVDGNTITITNLEVTMKVTFEGDPFNACLPIDMALKGLKHVNGDFDININGSVAKFKAGEFEFEVPTSNIDDFPACPEVQGEYTHIEGVSIGDALKFLDNTGFTKLRPILNGVAFVAPDGLLNIVSTSGHCLYEQRTNIPFNREFVLPLRACMLIKDVNSFDINSDGKMASIRYDNVELMATLLAGEFPKYKAMIPKNESVLNIDWFDLSSSIERVSEFSDGSSKLVVLNVRQNSVEVIGKDILFSASARETLQLKSPSTPIEIGLKANYVAQALKIGKGNLSYTAKDRAVTIENENKLLLVMPMSFN